MNRFKQTPLWAHAALLAVVLATGLLVIRPLVPMQVDEGSTVLQARQLERTGSWLIPLPSPVLDPKGTATVIQNADVGTKGRAFYAKHALYPLVLAAVDTVFGVIGFFVLSLFGTWLAAIGAARLARALDIAYERTTLWVTGVVSPLFFDGYVVVAHSLAAAAAVFAVIWALRLTRTGLTRTGLTRTDSDRPTQPAIYLTAIVLATALCAALRTEGLFLGPALAGALVLASFSTSLQLRRALPPAGGALIGTVIAYVGDYEARRAITGTPGSPSLPLSSSSNQSFFISRLHAFGRTWLFPHISVSPNDLWFIAPVVILAGIALGLRLRPSLNRAVLDAGWALSAICVIMGSWRSPHDTVVGLGVAFPLGWYGMWRLQKPVAGNSNRAIAACTALLIIVAVLLTTYETGGGIEWGGRFFAIALPIAIPFLIYAIAVDAARTVIRASMTFSCIALSLLALSSIRNYHQQTAGFTAEVRATITDAGYRPVTVFVQRLHPQFFWNGFDTTRTLIPLDGELNFTIERLHDTGIDHVVLVMSQRSDRDALAPYYRIIADHNVAVAAERIP